MTLYLIGPMNNVFRQNFPAFDLARDNLIQAGHNVISPADLDRKNFPGFDGSEETFPNTFDPFKALMEDFNCINESDGVFILRGWELSKGSKCEIALANYLNKKIYFEEDVVEQELSVIKQLNLNNCVWL